MAHEFIGCSVLISLIFPPAERVQGIVTNIENHRLYLKDVHLITSNIKTPFVVVEGQDIGDIEVLPTLPAVTSLENDSVKSTTVPKKVDSQPTRQPSATLSPVNPVGYQVLNQAPQKKDNDVPSVKAQGHWGWRSEHESNNNNPIKHISQTPSTPISSDSFADPAIVSIRKVHANGLKEHHNTPLSQTESLVSATLSEPFHNLSFSEVPLDQQGEHGITTHPKNQDSLQHGLGGKQDGKKRRRRKRKKAETRRKLSSPPRSSIMSMDTTPVRLAGGKYSSYPIRVDRALGVAPYDGDDGHLTARPSNVKTRQEGRAMWDQRETSEWEAEDASNIHTLPDFDFAANLSKFDKRTVFSQFKNVDTTADEARLVGHNRMLRSGTNGGKNLHFFENVLDTPHLTPKLGTWSSEAGESEAGESELEGTLESHVSMRKDRPQSYARRRHDRPRSAASTGRDLFSPVSQSLSSSQTMLNRMVSLTPLQLVEAEAFAVSDMGLSEDIMTENAARGIAEVVMRDLKDRTVAIKQPQMIIFAGDHKTGARAISAGRHLINHGVEVVAAVLDANDGLSGRSSETLLPTVRQAIFSFRKAGGKIMPAQTLFRALESPRFSPHIFLDAVQGIHLQMSDLSPDAQANVADLLEVFKNFHDEEHVLSIDVPLGRDSITGKVVTSNGQSSLRWPHHVIFLGAPKTWREVLLGMAGDETDKTMMLQASKSWVVDLGFKFAKFQRCSSANKTGWGKPWVEELGVD